MALERTLSIVKPDGVSRQSDRRGLSPLREGRSVHHRRAHAAPVRSSRPRAVLRRAPRAAVLQGPGALHDLRSGGRAGARGRERDRQATARSWAPPTRRRPPRAPSAPTSPRASSRTWCTARTPPRPRRARSPTSSAPRSCTRAPESALRATPPWTARPSANAPTCSGCRAPALEAFVAELGSKPFRARQLMNWLYKRGVGSLRGDDRSGQGLPRAARRARARCSRREIVSVQRSADGTAQVAAARRCRAGVRDGLHPGDRPRHAVHLLAGRLRARLLVLLDRAAGLQPQPDHRRDRRPGLARAKLAELRRSQARRRRASSPTSC